MFDSHGVQPGLYSCHLMRRQGIEQTPTRDVYKDDLENETLGLQTDIILRQNYEANSHASLELLVFNSAFYLGKRSRENLRVKMFIIRAESKRVKNINTFNIFHRAREPG